MKRFYMIIYDGKYIVKDKENEVPSVRCKNEGECREVITYWNDTLMYKNYYSEEESKLRKRVGEVLTENHRLNICLDVLIKKLNQNNKGNNYQEINDECHRELIENLLKEIDEWG